MDSGVSLSLSLFICKMGIIIVSNSQGSDRVNEQFVCVLAWCLIYNTHSNVRLFKKSYVIYENLDMLYSHR